MASITDEFRTSIIYPLTVTELNTATGANNLDAYENVGSGPRSSLLKSSTGEGFGLPADGAIGVGV